MITKNDIYSKLDGEVIEALGFIKTYEKKPTKNGGSYLDGKIEVKGSVPFKVWSGKLYDEMVKYDYSSTVCKIRAKVNVYNGTTLLILEDVKAIEDGTFDLADFLEDKYDAEGYFTALTDLLSKKLSPEAFAIFDKIYSDEELRERFKIEFAASGWHDAVKSGLLAHSFKVTHIMSRALLHYPMLKDRTDILLLGSAVHDIGKIMEYTVGSISSLGAYVSHHTFGVEILLKYKDFIIEKKDEEFFYKLLSIIEQHHGAYEESPRTIEAFLVFQVDYLESRFQIVNEVLESGKSDVLRLDNFQLH